jgi:hypothetical protein
MIGRNDRVIGRSPEQHGASACSQCFETICIEPGRRSLDIGETCDAERLSCTTRAQNSDAGKSSEDHFSKYSHWSAAVLL